MGEDVEIQCRCGKIHGVVRDASPRTVSRVVCYCDDCQAFLHHIGRADLLDARGGTEIIQVPPAAFVLDRGTENVTGLRLGPKGLFRFHASCCKSPLGNLASPAIPFIGLPHELFSGIDEHRREALFGTPWRILGKFAIGGKPEGPTTSNVRGIARTGRLLAGAKLTGKSWPNPFFEKKSRAPRYTVTTLSPAERDALRPLCGPTPKQPAA